MIIRMLPNLSATAPMNGVAMPHIRFCTAMARPKSLGVMARSRRMSVWNSPKVVRVPRFRLPIRQPAKATIQMAIPMRLVDMAFPR